MSPISYIDLLLVEDSSDDAEITKRSLAKIGLSRFQWVKDGEEALLTLFGSLDSQELVTVPKVILLDLKLPKIDGFEVLSVLRKSPQGAKVPVVILSSSNEESDLRRSYQLGANSYIVKPLEFNKYSELVIGVVEYWITKNRAPR